MTNQIKKNRIAWLSVLQGFSMLLVVLGHITLTDKFQDPAYPATAMMERVVYSFHMPLFIFISGWLFYLTVIHRNTPYKDMVAKKLSRLGIPFLFFTVATMLIKLALSSVVKRPVNLQEIIDTFVLFSSNPLEEMWFITVLLLLMIIYPVYSWLVKKQLLVWGLAASIVLFFVVPTDIKVFRLSALVRMAPYFIAGIICSRYGIIEKYASKWWLTLLAIVLFIAINVLQTADPYLQKKAVDVLKSTFGIILSVCLCSFITSLRPRTFDSFSPYTFQIYLLGIFFQMAIRLVYGKVGHLSDAIYPTMFVLSIFAGIYIPVMISKVVQRYLPNAGKLIGL